MELKSLGVFIQQSTAACMGLTQTHCINPLLAQLTGKPLCPVPITPLALQSEAGTKFSFYLARLHLSLVSRSQAGSGLLRQAAFHCHLSCASEFKSTHGLLTP